MKAVADSSSVGTRTSGSRRRRPPSASPLVGPNSSVLAIVVLLCALPPSAIGARSSPRNGVDAGAAAAAAAAAGARGRPARNNGEGERRRREGRKGGPASAPAPGAAAGGNKGGGDSKDRLTRAAVDGGGEGTADLGNNEEYEDLIDMDDINLLDSIFGGATRRSSGQRVEGGASMDDEAVADAETNKQLLVDDDEIDGLFERANRLLSEDDGDEDVFGGHQGIDMVEEGGQQDDLDNLLSQQPPEKNDGADIFFDEEEEEGEAVLIPQQQEAQLPSEDYDDVQLFEDYDDEDAHTNIQSHYDGQQDDLQLDGTYDYEYESYTDPTLAMDDEEGDLMIDNGYGYEQENEAYRRPMDTVNTNNEGDAFEEYNVEQEAYHPADNIATNNEGGAFDEYDAEQKQEATGNAYDKRDYQEDTYRPTGDVAAIDEDAFDEDGEHEQPATGNAYQEEAYRPTDNIGTRNNDDGEHEQTYNANGYQEDTYRPTDNIATSNNEEDAFDDHVDQEQTTTGNTYNTNNYRHTNDIDYDSRATFAEDHGSTTSTTSTSSIDDIIRAHRDAVARDMEDMGASDKKASEDVVMEQVSASQQQQQQPPPPPLRGQQPQRKQQGRRSSYSSSSDDPRSYGYGHSSFGGGGGGGDPSRESKKKARMERKERNFRRTVASDVHKSYTSAVAAVIRGDASPHVPANLFGQTLKEERAATKLAGLGPEFDEEGMYNYGAYCSEEELRTYSEWSHLLHSTSGNQCGAVDVKSANAKLYGGAQYHRAVRCFSALLLTLPLPTVTEEELSLLLTASGSAGTGGGHDGPDLLRTAAILCRTKMEGLVRFALDELTGRVEYILLQRCWECVNYSALVRPASEAGTNVLNYGREGRSSDKEAAAMLEDVPYKYSDLEETFQGVVREAYKKFVKKSVAEAAQMGWTDATALLRYVSWDMANTKARRRASGQRNHSGPSPALKPIRGGARGDNVNAGKELTHDQTPGDFTEAASQPLRPAKATRRATTVRPVKRSKRRQEAKAVKEEVNTLNEHQKSQQDKQGLFSKVRLFRRTGKDQNEGDGSSPEGDVSAYYDLNDLYGLDDDNDDEAEYNDEGLGDMVGGVLNRGVVDDDEAATGHQQSVHIGQMSADIDEDYGEGFALSKSQAMEDDEMLNILLRAAAAAASSNQGGGGMYETQTRAAMTALVKFVTDKWRRDLVGLIVGKFNSFCLLGFHSEFGAFLRQEIEQKLSELEGENNE